MSGRPAAFLDRDGVINEDRDCVHRPEDFAWMPGMPDAIRLLNEAGYLVVVVTNQSGIGRGYYTGSEYQAFERWIDERLAEAGAHVDATYHCPHFPVSAGGPEAECDCRKPAPGMILRAIDELGIDPAASFLIGDKPRDIEAAAAAGVRGVLYEGGDVSALVRRLIG